MLKTRVIPTLLWKNESLVKGVKFNSWRKVGTVLPAIKVYQMRQVDEIIILDISATGENRNPDYQSIEEFSSECFVPLTIGGGITTTEQVRQLLRSGADKVTVNTAAFANPRLITDIADKFGSQCIVVSIDVMKVDNRYLCFRNNGTIGTGIDVVDWACEMERRGAGELLITSIERDGTMSGYDLELIKAVTDTVNIPVIAAGGAGNYEHMQQAIMQGNAAAVAAASIFHFTQQTPKEAKLFLGSNGIKVRKTS